MPRLTPAEKCADALAMITRREIPPGVTRLDIQAEAVHAVTKCDPREIPCSMIWGKLPIQWGISYSSRTDAYTIVVPAPIR